MGKLRLGFWAGIAGVATTLIVGGKTVWMAALIVGLVIGLLSGSDDSIATPQAGARKGALNGVVAGVLLIVGQLLRSLWIDPLAGQTPLDLGMGDAGSAIVAGLIEAIGAGYLGEITGGVLGSHYADIFAFLALILVLTLRPSGLLGERVADRA